jgi:dTDP-4-dehydrorhamnose reductase
VVDEFEPDIIINAAAMTNVDQCETDREHAWRANVTSVENLVHAARLAGSRIVHISTDYVFDGKNGPYAELDRPNPLCYYGRTKLASENVLRLSGVPSTVIRTMILYGVGYGVKLNFALWLLKNLSESKPVRVVDDQIGNPTLADDLAFAILRAIELGRTGLYHVAGNDLMSRFDFAVAIARIFNLNRKLISPIKTSVLRQPAQRPLRSGFITLKAQTDLDAKMSGTDQGVLIMKNQIHTD